MCGALLIKQGADMAAMGSSPHVRGTLRALTVQPVKAGIIPACAGHFKNQRILGNKLGDHPRMCGALLLSF